MSMCVPARAAVIGTLALFLPACGTSLDVYERDRNVDDPGGVVVNARALYAAKATLKIPGVQEGEAKFAFAGVDPDKVLALNICRMPFADGKLSVTLDDRQVPTEVAITSEAALPGALEAAKAGLEARNKFVETREAKDK